MKSLAVIGTGIAGMYCAWALRDRFDVTVYEKNDYAGGHTNTVEVAEEGGRRLPIDTGFMVFNRVTYPNLIRLFESLEVPVKPAPMSFSVQHCPTNLEFCGSGLNGLFAQRRNLARPRFWRLLANIHRFNSEAPSLLQDSNAEITLRDYCRQRHFHQDLLDFYLLPMSSAVWSTPPDAMLQFPAVTLIRFFFNHGFLGLHTQHPWYTVDGGSRVYRDRMMEPLKNRLRLSQEVRQVERRAGHVWVTDSAGQAAAYDGAILASHADESLQMLLGPTEQEKALLSRFQYQSNTAILHTDESVMPKTRGCWSSWNYRVSTTGASTIYWMNSLQGVSEHKNYFVSINEPEPIAEKHVLRRISYSHPVFTVESNKAQKTLAVLNEKGPIYFCGSYFRYGFHEDALVSAMDVVGRLS